jgi:hypothetical protein
VIKFLTTGIAIAGLLGAPHVLGAPVDVLAGASHVKGDRLDTPAIEESCGDWPYYHHACLRDLTNTSHARRRARIMARTNHRQKSFLALLGR